MEPGIVLLSGQPARALLDHAFTNHYDVVVIGRRGRGATKALLGSVATQISREADMPVLLVGAPPHDFEDRVDARHRDAASLSATLPSATSA